MTLRVHVLLLLCLVGCAAERLIVPEDDWQTVPAGQRTKLDQQHAASLAASRAELAAATTGLAAAQRAQPVRVAPPVRMAVPAGDAWSAAVRDHEQARGAAFTRVGTAQADWQRSNLAWSQVRLDTAQARLDLVECEREADRARLIDRSLVVGDNYDTAPTRGQFSRAQQRWYKLNQQARTAQRTLERASASLESAKEAYAQLMRSGPGQAGQPAIAAAPPRPTRLELASWAVTRNDIRRRRGLRHFLDDAAVAPAGLRKAKIQLAARAVILAPAAPEVATAPAPIAKPIEPAKQAVNVPVAKPGPIAKPVEPAKQAVNAPVAKPVIVAKPVEQPKQAANAPVPKPVIVAKPVEPPKQASLAARPAPAAKPVEPPKQAASAPVAKPVTVARPAPVAKPVEPPKQAANAPVAKPVTVARPAPVAKPVEPPKQAANAPVARPTEPEPLFPSPASAKPVEGPANR